MAVVSLKKSEKINDPVYELTISLKNHYINKTKCNCEIEILTAHDNLRVNLIVYYVLDVEKSILPVMATYETSAYDIPQINKVGLYSFLVRKLDNDLILNKSYQLLWN